MQSFDSITRTTKSCFMLNHSFTVLPTTVVGFYLILINNGTCLGKLKNLHRCFHLHVFCLIKPPLKLKFDRGIMGIMRVHPTDYFVHVQSSLHIKPMEWNQWNNFLYSHTNVTSCRVLVLLCRLALHLAAP